MDKLMIIRLDFLLTFNFFLNDDLGEKLSFIISLRKYSGIFSYKPEINSIKTFKCININVNIEYGK